MIDIVRDFFRFLGVVLLGMDDGGKNFSESLEMAERYLRWGRERNDPRDYRAARENAERCRDENAPKPDMLLRKYSACCEAYLGLIQCDISRYRSETSEHSAEKKDLTQEIEAARTAVNESKRLVEVLEAEGSMIKAKEEKQHTAELQRRLDRLAAKRDSGEVDNDLARVYRELVSECLHYQGLVEQALAHMQAMEDVDNQIRQTYVNGIMSSLQARMRELQNLAPSGYSGPAATPPAPPPPAQGGSGNGQ